VDRIPALHRRLKELERMNFQQGKILSFTTIRHPPAGFGPEPYIVALIEHPDGSKSLAQLTREGMPPAIGAEVIPHLRRIRTMRSGLHINDLKYEVIETQAAPLFTMHAYVLALTGPSGVGKTTITRSLLSLFQPLVEQVPIVATRRPRKTDLEPFVHVSEDEFEAMVARGEIIAHTVSTDRHEYRAGYRREDIEAVWKQTKLPIVTTDLRLLEGLSKALGRETILSCGLLPPGISRRRMLSALLHRLRSRGQNTEEQIELQLKSAEADLKAFVTKKDLFDHLFVNDRLETCVESIKELVVPQS